MYGRYECPVCSRYAPCSHTYDRARDNAIAIVHDGFVFVFELRSTHYTLAPWPPWFIDRASSLVRSNSHTLVGLYSLFAERGEA
jgi:hypothetical protein